jgi:TolA-binding protein
MVYTMFTNGNIAAVFVLCLVILSGCAPASGGKQEQLQADLDDAGQREEMAALKQAAESSYEREKALAERLAQTEAANIELGQRLETMQAELEASRKEPEPAVPAPTIEPGLPAVAEFEPLTVYRQALDLYRTRQYETALGYFAQVVQRAPESDRADNAQYWMGECHYGLGRWRPALAAFTKVFAYRKTEKADDSQLKIARCYLNLGEKDQALLAFQKLLEEYADSEYIEAARKEMGYLEGPP